VVAGCAAEDLEVVTGPDPSQITPSTAAIVDDQADELAEEAVAGGSTNAGPDETSTSSSSSTTSSTTEPPPDDTTSSTTPPSSDTTPPPGNQTGAYVDQAAAAQSVAFVNDHRRDNGSGDLRADAELTALAEAWAQQMAADQEMRHNPNLSDQIPAGYSAWGENVAYGFDPGEINEAWWNSDGHRANMLNPDYTALGVAFVVDDAGDYWAVQVFAG
jgi:uncharacterized protein YkwD